MPAKFTIGPPENAADLDPSKLPLRRDGQLVGYIEWPQGRLQFMALTETGFAPFSYSEMRQIVEQMDRIKERTRKTPPPKDPTRKKPHGTHAKPADNV